MAKGACNKARRAREKAKPLREKSDYSKYLVEPSAFEKLPCEIRQQIYFYVGRIPIAKRMLVTYPPELDNPHAGAVVIKDAFFRSNFRLTPIDGWGLKQAFWQFFRVHYCNEQDGLEINKIEVSSLLAVSKLIRCELLYLLLDTGISVHIGEGEPSLQQYMFGSASIQQIREVRLVATLSHVASFALMCNGGDKTNLLRKNLTFIAQHAVNLREITLEVCSRAFSLSDWRVNLNRVIRSLHDFVRTTSSDHFDLVRLEGQTLRKKDFPKTCAWAVAVIQQARKDSTRVHGIDISSIEEHHHKYVFCAELRCYH